ncbi:MAG TPA: hypothetical protein VF843_14825 [Streptosporangiaceae bacterium]
MHPRQFETIATQRSDELRVQRMTVRDARTARPDARRLRSQAGWTLIAVGLRLASSASR